MSDLKATSNGGSVETAANKNGKNGHLVEKPRGFYSEDTSIYEDQDSEYYSGQLY